MQRLGLNPHFVRFAIHYAAFFIAFGAYLPYFPLWLAERGLSPELIGLVAAGGMVGRVILSPIGAAWMDGAPRRRDALIGFSWAGLAAFLVLTPARGEVMIAVLGVMAGATFAAQSPLIDAMATREAVRKGFNFGRARAFGSASFIVGNLGAGWLIGRYGGEAVLVWMIAGAALTIAATYALPAGRPDPLAPGTVRAPWRLTAFLTPGLVLAIAATSLVQGAHGFNYAFSALAWQARGISEAMVGALWAWGVCAEIVFLWVAARRFRNWPPGVLLLAAAGVSVLRWGLMALAPPVWALFILQTGHAFTFTAAYIAFLRYATETVPDRYLATAQAANSAVSSGVVLAATTAASGWLYMRFGEAGFAGMILPAALGGVFALALLWAARSKPGAKSIRTDDEGEAV